MKKKVIAIVCAAAIAVAGVGGWFAFSSHDKESSKTESVVKKNYEGEFAVFIRNFCADKEWQLSRIQFPLGKLDNLSGNGDSQYSGWYTKDFWIYPDLEDLTSNGSFKMESPSKVTYTREASDKQYGTQMTFAKNGGKWMLVSATLTGGKNASAKNAMKASEKAQKKFDAKHKKTGEFAELVIEDTPGKYPELSERLITEKDLAFKTAKEKKYMINEIYARHAHAFADKAVRKQFMYQAWYAPLFEISENDLSEIERSNIELLTK